MLKSLGPRFRWSVTTGYYLSASGLKKRSNSKVLLSQSNDGHWSKTICSTASFGNVNADLSGFR